MREDLAEFLIQSFLQGGPCQQFRHGQGCPLFDVVHPAFPLPTTASPTLQGALKDGFGKGVTACDMPEPCKFLSVARRGSCGPTRKLILLRIPLLVLCSKQEIRRSFLVHLVSKAWILPPPPESASRVHAPWMDATEAEIRVPMPKAKAIKGSLI